MRNSVQKADRVIVQTSALAAAIHAQAQVPEERLEVVPHGPGLVAHAERPHSWPEGKLWRIGYVTKFGVQKDFATALRALRELIARGRAVTLVLTLDQAVPGAAAVRHLIAELGVAGSVENRGNSALRACSRSMMVSTCSYSRRYASPSAFLWSKRWRGACQSWSPHSKQRRDRQCRRACFCTGRLARPGGPGRIDHERSGPIGHRQIAA